MLFKYRLLAPVLTCSLLPLLGLGLWSPVAADSCARQLPVTEEQARDILATERPFESLNRDLFLSLEHPDWIDALPIDYVNGPAQSEAQTQVELRDFLERRFPCDPTRVIDGLTVFTDPIARLKAPEPGMRAALAALVGTIGEPAIDHLLYRTPVTLIHFGVVVQGGQGLPSRLGIAYDLPDGTRQIVLDRRFQYAPFPSFSPILFHESLHTGADDDVAGMAEEAIASALESIVYMQMLLVDPDLALIPDELTRFSNNPMALARINSGPVGSSALTLFVPESDVQIDPTWVEPLTEFWEFYGSRHPPPDDPGFRQRETKGHPMLADVLGLIAEAGVLPPENPNFDPSTAGVVDQNLGVLTSAELVFIACTLQVDIRCS